MLDAPRSVHPASESATKSSYIVTNEIAKCKKTHTNGEALILAYAKIMADLAIGTHSSSKLAKIPLSDRTAQHRISDMSDNIKP